MAKAIALSRKTVGAVQARQIELLSSVGVLACAAALIFAGQPFPI